MNETLIISNSIAPHSRFIRDGIRSDPIRFPPTPDSIRSDSNRRESILTIRAQKFRFDSIRIESIDSHDSRPNVSIRFDSIFSSIRIDEIMNRNGHDVNNFRRFQLCFCYALGVLERTFISVAFQKLHWTK